MEIVYHGHSCVQLITGGKSILIDPFISGNPLAKTKPQEVKTDYILLTHAHTDHILDTEAIAKANDATVVASFELATYYGAKQLKTIGMNIGGQVDLGFAKAKMIHAFHSSSIMLEEGKIIYGGMPGGYIIQAEGLTLLHSGDTGLFSDMRMFGERYNIDVAFLPIGDLFTMGPDDALQAAEWLNARIVVPLHYNTFPPIRKNPSDFVRRLEEQGRIGKALAPGEKFELSKP
jgi:L-ascorbate metabolism protein UlaG (beta-lactamase superfamily)